MDKARIELGFARAKNSSPGWEQYYQWLGGEKRITLFFPGKAKTEWLFDGASEEWAKNQSLEREKIELRLLWTPQLWKEQEKCKSELQKDCLRVSLLKNGRISCLSWKEYKTGWYEIKQEVTCGDVLIVGFYITAQTMAWKEEWQPLQMEETPGHIAARARKSLQGAAAVLALGMRSCRPAVLLVGPPRKREADVSVFQRFFETEGFHIVCGGTTATLVSNYLEQPLEPILESGTDEIPAMGYLKGVDLVTEGVITLQKLAEFTEQYLENSCNMDSVIGRTDAVALLADQLINRSNPITIYFGCAVNPAHEALNINFTVKQSAVFRLVKNLQSMGKQVVLQIN